MRTRRVPFLRCSAPGLALCLAVAGVPGHAAAAPEGDFEQLIAEADAHVDQGRHDEALSAYTRAYRAMPAELQVSGVGEFVAMAAGKAALEDFAARGDRRSLEQARDVLRAFVTAAQTADPQLSPAPTDAASQRLAEIDAQLGSGPPPSEPPPLTDDAGDEPSAAPPPEPDAPPDRSRAGLALAVSGGVAALAGVGLLVAGARQVPWIERKLDEQGWQPTDEGYDDQIADAERVRAIDLGLGAAALVVGVGLGVTGAVLLARSKRAKPGSVAVAPALGPGIAGLTTTVRF